MTAAPASPASRVAAVVLAGGRSRRAGAANKLLAPIAGKAVLRHVVDALAASRVERILAVTGHDAAAAGRALAGSGAAIVHNPGWREGLASSLRTGLAALARDTEAALLCLGDMPAVQPATIDRILAAGTTGAVVVPTCRRRRGNPVLWPRRLFPAMMRLTGDCGAWRLIVEGGHPVVYVETGDDGVLMDIDTAPALARARAAMAPAIPAAAPTADGAPP